MTCIRARKFMQDFKERLFPPAMKISIVRRPDIVNNLELSPEVRKLSAKKKGE